MNEPIDRSVHLQTVPNLRTLGGLPVAGGTVAHGLLFRSATLGAVSPADGEKLKQLGIRRVFDFRTDGERESAPDLLPEGISGEALDVLGDHAQDLAASLGYIGVPGETGRGSLSAEQRTAVAQGVTEALGDGRGIELMKQSYRNIVSSDSALRAYRAFYLALAAGTEPTPSLFHCTTGKDRTGWAAASLLLLLGADEATVMADYLQTNTDILPMIEPMLATAEAAGIDPGLLLPVLTVQQEVLEAAYDEMRARFGSIEGYFADGLGLDAATLQVLRERFVTAG